MTRPYVAGTPKANGEGSERGQRNPKRSFQSGEAWPNGGQPPPPPRTDLVCAAVQQGNTMHREICDNGHMPVTRGYMRALYPLLLALEYPIDFCRRGLGGGLTLRFSVSITRLDIEGLRCAYCLDQEVLLGHCCVLGCSCIERTVTCGRVLIKGGTGYIQGRGFGRCDEKNTGQKMWINLSEVSNLECTPLLHVLRCLCSGGTAYGGGGGEPHPSWFVGELGVPKRRHTPKAEGCQGCGPAGPPYASKRQGRRAGGRAGGSEGANLRLPRRKV